MPDPTPKPPAKTTLSYATDLNDSVAALTTLSAAATENGSALMMAMKYAAMIGTEASDGDSMAASANAQKVLDAKTMLMEAINAAMAAKTAAETAKDGTDDADVIAALDSAIMAAETQIEAAEGVLNGDDLAGYVDMVTGGDDADPMGTPASVGKSVAMAIAMALGPTSNTDGTGTRVTFGTVAPTATVNPANLSTLRAATNPVAKANKFDTDNHLGKTWAMIVGEDNVMDKQIADSTTGNFKTVKAASVSGMTLGSTQATGEVAAGSQVDTGINYKGIPGGVFCGGSDCMVEAVENNPDTTVDESTTQRKLVGSWYFTPTNVMAFWMKAAGATDYTEELYVKYGHWLVVDDGSTTAANSGQVTVLPYAALSGTSPGVGSWVAGDPTATDAGLRASSATYSGMAAGRSVHKELDSDGTVTDIQSGRFTAHVSLTATFAGTSSTLGGKVNNFQGSAVDPSWTVSLNAITTGDGAVTTGVAEATGQDGDWTSTAYGETTARPVGIFGSFNAHFTDGHAAGAYATRKDK